MAPTNLNSRCKAQAKSGKRCRAAATACGLCFFHANPNKASELGSIGGRKKRSPLAASLEPLPPLDNATAVRDFIGQLIPDTLSGKVNPRATAAIVSLLNLQLRAIEAVTSEDLQRRVAVLEARLDPTVEPQEILRSS